MKWFVDLGMRSKLFISFGLMIMLLAVVIVTAYRDLVDAQQLQKRLVEVDFAKRADLRSIMFNQERIRALSLAMLVLKERQRMEALRTLGDNYGKENDELLRNLIEREKDPRYTGRLREFDDLRKVFRETRDKEVLPLIFAGRFEEAKRAITGTQAERNEKMGAIIESLVNEAQQDVQKAVERSEKAMASFTNTLVVLGLIAIVLAASAVYLLSRIIAEPLQEISGVAAKIAAGDLTVSVRQEDRKDEVGTLARTFNTMAENMRELNRQIQEAVSSLASSASEILSSTTEVASSVTETASSVSETTSTVEEVKQTAHVVSQKAQYVSEASQKAVRVSQAGGRAVDETVAKMDRIRRQMESVAESVVRLSEQSQAIGDIIQTVNDLAEQSNLLAVNASIEAAKAGEHGKGFAVVAQEVKSLADQSKQATAQVRSILNDIQKATSSAVMATEQGSKAVDEGVRQSEEAGEAIKALAASISEAAQAAIQIAASSQQQLVGMEQVIGAMGNIKLATEQNVTGTKQTEDAAHNIHEQGQKLKQLVAQYKV